MRKFNMILIIFVLCLLSSTVSAEDTNMSKGILYVNNILIESTDSVQVKDQAILLPLRTIFESLGAIVDWQEESGNIMIKYNDELYNCYIKEPNPGYKKYFYVKKESTNENIYLTSMSIGGAYVMIKDRTYLYADTAKRLFEALGCTVKIDSQTHTVKIWN